MDKECVAVSIKVCLNRYSWGAGKLGSEDSSVKCLDNEENILNI